MKIHIKEDTGRMNHILQQFFQHLEHDPDLPVSYREAWEQDLRGFAVFLQAQGRGGWQEVTSRRLSGVF
jgi:hypothetical protein